MVRHALARLSLGCLVAAGLCGAVFAQPAPAAAPAMRSERPETLVSPEIGADRRVTWRIKAPKAAEVTVTASLGVANPKPPGAFKDQPGQWVMPLQKGADGVWSLTVGPLEPEVYRYAFVVDGMRALDLANPAINSGGVTPWSYFEIPGSPPRFDEARDPPHGAIQFRTYRVGGTGLVHRVAIYTPPDYDREPARKFPVLYLFHSGGDAEEGWSRLGRVAAIQENLLAAGKARPMLVVMPYGDIEGDATALPAIEAFGRELMGDIMPMVEKNYRVQADRDGRALAGASMGAGQSFTLGLRHLDRFAWVAEFSAGAFNSAKFDMEAQVPGFLKDPAAANRQLKLLFIGVGTEDTRYPGHVKLDEMLTKAGVRHEFHTTPGEHEWKAWRHLLAKLMPELFQPAR